jgi:hypothetical protein
MSKTEVGSVYKRIKADGDGPPSLKVVGQKGGRWVCQEVETFSAPFELSPIELHQNYGGDGESVQEVNEIDAWKQITPHELREGNIRQIHDQQQKERDAISPEAYFRQLDREAAEAD